MKQNVRFIGIVTGVTLLIIGVGIGLGMAQQSATGNILADPAQARDAPEIVKAEEPNPGDSGNVAVEETQDQELPQAETVDILKDQTGLTPDQARSVAIAAQPGASVIRVERGSENGALVYNVELDNGQQIKVDAGSGSILYVELTHDRSKDQASERAMSQEGTNITPEEAKAIAEKAVDGAKAVEVEQEQEHGRLIYEVELDNGSEVEVDAGSGDILEIEHEDDDEDEADDDNNGNELDDDDDDQGADDDDLDEDNDDDGEQTALQDQAKITPDEARAIAEDYVMDATVLELELEREDGGLVYEAEMDNGVEVEIDANTGDVLEVEMDDD